ncbi:hypothetical protein CRU96_11165 [Malaciobacter halophilus]|nr:hypothetical protein [Malaciobacter halophilus]RYA22839.1 hypothetical protein CRU96_11165 [Malaciobacter halophilus]
MLESKSEELKKALEKSMSKENIQEKLMEEKLKQDQLNQQEKQKQKRIFYILITIFTLIIISLSAYLLSTNDNSQIAKEDTNKKPQKEVTKNVNSTKEIKDIQKDINKPIIKEKIITKEVIVEKKVPLSNENFKEFFNTKKFNLAKCYNYKTFEYMPTKACKESLSIFLTKNKKAIRLEVIGVISKDDIKEASKLSKDEKIQKYIVRGIARDRVVEASWLVKELIKDKNIVITPVNYYIKSKENNKGIVLRAYY